MKKLIALLVTLVLCLSICACGTQSPSAIEQLTEKEHGLFEALIKLTTEDFYEPSAVRVLELGDFREKTSYDLGPDTVVVRLQGENRVGGTLNHYYLVCTAAGEDPDQDSIELTERILEYEKAVGMEYLESAKMLLSMKGEVGDYVELSDDYSFEKLTNVFDIGRVNNALAEYWEEKGF